MEINNTLACEFYAVLKSHCVVNPGADPNNPPTSDEIDVAREVLGSLNSLGEISASSKVAWLWNDLEKRGVINNGDVFQVPSQDDHHLLDHFMDLGILDSSLHSADDHKDELVEEIASRINEKIDLPLVSESEEQSFFENTVKEAIHGIENPHSFTSHDLPIEEGVDGDSEADQGGETDEEPREVDGEEDNGNDVNNH